MAGERGRRLQRYKQRRQYHIASASHLFCSFGRWALEDLGWDAECGGGEAEPE
ncbi:MAG: hypothetical protein ABFS45_05650 [Pseudomonadota bacterium]